MENQITFDQYYQEKLLPQLALLDIQRKKLKKTYLIFIFSILLVILILVAGTIDGMFYGIIGIILGVAFIVAMAIVAWLIEKNIHRPYVSSYKEKIIKYIIKYFSDDLTYDPFQMISQERFMKSAIFLKKSDSYKGGDMVYGKIGKTDIQFSEILSEYEQTTTDSKGNTSSSMVTIFKGIFFVADFNKNFKSRTVVLPDTAQKILGRFGNRLQSLNIVRDQLITLEDPDFEKEFVVYAKDQIEARYILSPSLMKRILDYRKKSNKEIHLSFVDSFVHVAISIQKDLFEPRIYRSIVNFKFISESYHYLQLFIDLVEDLNLNIRIWSKE